MKAFFALVVLGLVSQETTSRDIRLSKDCLNAVADRNNCCKGVPDAWLAHLRNPENSNSYYQCANSVPVLMPCPAGLEWSVEGDICDWPVPSPAPVPEESDESDESSEESTQLPQGCYDGTVDVHTCCVGVTAFWVHIPDPKDCTKFYQCDNGKAVHKDCPAGLHWSIVADRCEWPENAQCQGNPIKPTSPPVENTPTDAPVEENTTEAVEQPTDAPIQETTVESTDAPIIEPTDPPAEEVTTEDANQTDAPVQETTKGEVIEPTTAAPIVSPTNPPAEVTTDGVVVTDTPVVETTEGVAQPTLPGGCYDGTIDVAVCCEGITAWWVHLPDPKDCGKFYHCDNGIAVHKDCPAGLHWSIGADRCEWPDNAGCEAQPGKPTDAPIEETTPGEEVNPPVESTTEEVGPSTDASLPETTVAEVVPTNPPVEETTEEPIVEPTNPPTETTTDKVEPPTDAPVEETTVAEVISTTEDSNEGTTDPEIIEPTDPPAEELTTDVPVQETTIGDTIAPTNRPSTAAPTVSPTNSPTQETTESVVVTDSPVVETTESAVQPTEKPTLPSGCYDGSIEVEVCCEGITAWWVHLPDPKDCGKFYHCDNGVAVHKDCPAGLHWSIVADRCEWPDKAGCEAQPSKPTDAPIIETTTVAAVSPTNPPPTPTIPSVETTTEEAVQPTTITTKFPVEETDVPIIEPTIPPVESTTEEIQKPTDAPIEDTTEGSGESTNPPVEDTDAPIIDPTMPPIEITTEEVQEPTDAPTESPVLPSGCYDGRINVKVCCEGITAWWVHLPDPEDCGKFYHCDNGVAVHKDCPAGLHWSIKADRCEWPDIAGCKSRPSQPSTDTTTAVTEPIPTETVPVPTETEPIPTETVSVPTQTEPTPTETVSVPTQTEPTPTETKPIPTETESVPTESESVPTVTEPVSTETEPVPTTPAVTTTESASNQTEPNNSTVPSNTTVPSEGNTTPSSELTTPSQNQTTTNRPWTTTLPSNNVTEPTPGKCEPTPICHQCITGVFPADQCCIDVQNWQKIKLANAADCNSYYECIDETAVLRKCPDGLHWSSKNDRCEWPKNSECVASTTAPSVETTVGNGGGNFSTPGSGSISEECLYGKEDAATCCRNLPYWLDVLLQNNKDCHTYYQCVHGVPHVRPCPANLWWSVTANRCEWLENATCTWETNN